MMTNDPNSNLLESRPGSLSEKGVSYLAGFFMLVAFGIGGNILGGLISIPVVAAMSGQSVLFVAQNLKDILGDPDFLREMQVMQTISAVFGFLVPTIFTASRLSFKPLTLTGFKNMATSKQVLLTLFIIATGLALSSALGYFTYKLPFPVNWRIRFDQMETAYAEAAAGLVSLDSIPNLVISLFVLAVVPAICEETFFRGGLQNYLYRHSGRLWMSVIVVSIIFSAVHFSVYGFLSRVALGIILGLLYQYSGKLWLSILAHFINNAAAVIMMYVQKANGKSVQDILSERDGSYLGFLVLPLVIFLFMQFRKQTQSPTFANGV